MSIRMEEFNEEASYTYPQMEPGETVIIDSPLIGEFFIMIPGAPPQKAFLIVDKNGIHFDYESIHGCGSGTVSMSMKEAKRAAMVFPESITYEFLKAFFSNIKK
jgi:hypothetical protein